MAENSSLEETLVLPSIECQLPLAEIYLKVRFTSEDDETPLTQDETSAAE